MNEQAELEAPRETISLPRRIVFVLLAVVLGYVAIEAAAFAGVWLHDGKAFSPSRLQQERAALIAGLDRAGPRELTDSQDAPHPYLGFVRNPDLQATVSEFGYPQSTPLFTRRADDRVVVAVVGGSVAFHFGKQGLPYVIEQLRQRPEFEGKEFVVANLAVGGYKQPQQLMTLNYLLTLGFEFDIMINIDGFNEVALYAAESAPRHVFPIYPRTWYATMNLTPDPELQRLQGAVLYAEDRIAMKAAGLSASPLRFSPAVNLLWRIGQKRRMRARAAALDAARLYEPPASPYSSTGPRVSFQSETDLYGHLASIWGRSSLQLDRLCRANGIRYYHFLQPNQYVPDSKPLTVEELRVAFRSDHPYREGAERGYPLLAREGRKLVEAGVRFIDLTNIFVEHTETLYIDDCCHVNESGNRLLSERVLGAILAELS